MNMFRELRADEIDCRIAQVKEEGLSLLLYKDARCDQNILDETVGPMNWKREHTRDNRNCVVSIWDDKKAQWISKEDTGTESNTEREKGLASDSFKRACFNWGIGRELYTAPFIWIKKNDFKVSQNGKCYDNFTVTAISYKNGVISGLKIRNEKLNREVFSWGTVGKEEEEDRPKQPDNEPEFVRPEPAQVKVETVSSVNPVFAYIKNEKAFMAERFGCTVAEMNARFKAFRKSLIDGKVVEDIPAEKLTMEQAKDLIEAIYANFMSDNVEKMVK